MIPDNRPVRGPLHSITPLEFVQVRRTPEEPLFNSLMEQYHYLGYEQPVGEHLKYLVKAGGQAIACLAWSERAAASQAAGPATLDGATKRASAMCTCWPTTRAF